MLQTIPTGFFQMTARLLQPEQKLPAMARRRIHRPRPAADRAGWLLRCWQAQCRHAARADRFVPYY